MTKKGILHIKLEYENAVTSKEDLLKIKIFKPEWVEQINPYLDFGIPDRE